MRDLNNALDSIDFLLHWRYTPAWIREILRMFKRSLERQLP
jgi:KaiC/GvpD/RAD55 family RecA-like ATPase